MTSFREGFNTTMNKEAGGMVVLPSWGLGALAGAGIGGLAGGLSGFAGEDPGFSFGRAGLGALAGGGIGAGIGYRIGAAPYVRDISEGEKTTLRYMQTGENLIKDSPLLQNLRNQGYINPSQYSPVRKYDKNLTEHRFFLENLPFPAELIQTTTPNKYSLQPITGNAEYTVTENNVQKLLSALKAKAKPISMKADRLQLDDMRQSPKGTKFKRIHERGRLIIEAMYPDGTTEKFY